MTQPPQGWPGEPQPEWQPPAPQPPQWQPPAWQQPAWQQPAWQQPAGPEQPQWAPPPSNQPWENLPPQGGPSPAKSGGRGKLIAAVVVAVAVVVGGAVTYQAVSDKNTTGAASPKAAVQTIITDLNNSDLIGVLDDLAPGERAALANPAVDAVNHLKRLNVLRRSADPASVSGVQFRAQNLAFAGQTITVNDHVQIVELTGGTITIGSDLTKVPFTGDFLKAAFPNGTPTGAGKQRTVNLADAVKANGPIRLAAQKVHGRWYPSLAYTIADNAAHSAGQTPSAADYIPAVGADSPQAAVKGVIDAAMNGDWTGVIKLLSPDELAAVHDYGRLLLTNAPSPTSSGFTINDLQLTEKPISGGAQRVSLSKLSITKDGSTVSVAIDNGCYTLTMQGQTQKECAADVVDMALRFLGGLSGSGPSLTQAQKDAVTHLFTGLTQEGVDTTQTGGKWFVAPVRSWLDIVTSLLGSLQGNDLIELAHLAHGG